MYTMYLPGLHLGVADRADGPNAVEGEEGEPARDKGTHDQT